MVYDGVYNFAARYCDTGAQGDVCPNTDSCTCGGPNSDTRSYCNGSANSDTNDHADADANDNTDTSTRCYTYADTGPDSDADADAHTDAHTGPDSDAGAKFEFIPNKLGVCRSFDVLERSKSKWNWRKRSNSICR